MSDEDPWHDYVVPWLRWVVGGSVENVALIALSPGAGTGSPTGNHNQQDKEQ